MYPFETGRVFEGHQPKTPKNFQVPKQKTTNDFLQKCRSHIEIKELQIVCWNTLTHGAWKSTNKIIYSNRKNTPTHTHTMLNIYDVKNPWPFVPVMGLSPTSSAVILLVSQKKNGHEGLVNCFKAQEFVPQKIPKDCKGKRQQPRIGKRVSAPKAQLKKHG